MHFKLLGSVLLIVGTCIGAGMLALPIATGELGFLGSLVLLVSCWAVMTAGAFLLLEVNLWLPQTSNLISMARETVGVSGQAVSWITYLLLLYSLLCAYIAGGSDLFHNLLATTTGWQVPASVAAVIFTCIFGTIVYAGIRSVDYANRGLMLIKFGAYFILVALLTPFISFDKLNLIETNHLTSIAAITVTITSFGFAAIVPSLREYFADDIKSLKIAILIGSLVPLLCYIAWDAAIMGIIPRDSSSGLIAIMASKNSTSDLVNSISTIVSQARVTFFAKLFTSICVVTSFLGVALCLSDFLADGLKMQKQGKNAMIIHLLAFLPPLIIVLFFPNAFIMALEYAGIYCIILLVLMPAWMVWAGRYKRGLAQDFLVPGGKPLLVALIIVSFILLIFGLKAAIPV